VGGKSPTNEGESRGKQKRVRRVQRFEHLSGGLKGKLTAEAFAAAVERGKALDVAQTAQEALVLLKTQPTQDA
jgi:hypothetical protein